MNKQSILRLGTTPLFPSITIQFANKTSLQFVIELVRLHCFVLCSCLNTYYETKRYIGSLFILKFFLLPSCVCVRTLTWPSDQFTNISDC